MNVQTEISQSSDQEFVTFSVARQKFCLEITQIREIRRWSPVTILPHAPSEMLGVMNLRGAIIPIYDLAARFGLGVSKEDARNVVVVSAVQGNPVGLLVESVSEIIAVNSSEIQATPDVNSETTRECIKGVISIAGDLARIINLESVIKPSELGTA